MRIRRTHNTDVNLVEIGGGNYAFLFDTLDPELYVTTGGTPILTSNPYILLVEMSYPNRTSSIVVIRISVVEVPTQLVGTSELLNYDEISLYEGQTVSLNFLYNDTWHGSSIQDASIMVNSSNSEILEIRSFQEDLNHSGNYIVEISAKQPFIFESILTITLEKYGFQRQVLEIVVEVYPVEGPYPRPPIGWGLPLLILIVVSGIYIVKRRARPKITTPIPDQDEKEKGEGAGAPT